jgi:predicted GIY-YIG superfamily endonuclease
MIARRDVEARHAMPEAYVYLLRCRDGSLYCGWTSDLDRRLAAHRS